MDRRDVLRALASAAAVPVLRGLTPENLWAVSRAAHASAGGLRVLNAHQNNTVTLLAEIIIPATDTPGATAARVNEFIDHLLADWFPADERDRFLRGLAELDARSVAASKAKFADATPEARRALVAAMDAEVAALRAADDKAADDQFFAQMKWLTLYGYYTSEIGQKQELHTEIIPGTWDACIPVSGTPMGGGR